MPGELASKDRVVGLKQTRRAVLRVAASSIGLRADPRLTEPLRELCRTQDVPCDGSMTLPAAGQSPRYRRAGRRCGIALRRNDIVSAGYKHRLSRGK